MEDEEDFQKRNTDCVYFLASPFTCKKGLDCEYRHNEIARLNPRDCWYWLAGNCLNPTCGFRHPPLDIHVETLSESSELPPRASVPVKKASVPCYFYFNGFCSKGDRCFFLHGNEPIFGSTMKMDTLPMNKRTQMEKDSGSSLTESIQVGPRVPPLLNVDSIVQENRDFELLPHYSPEKQTVPEKISDIGHHEFAEVKPYSPVLAEGFIQAKSPTYTDQSFEEPSDDHVEPKEQWDISPSFDAFVDIVSENFDYKEDNKHLATDRKCRGYVVEYEFEPRVEYDPIYAETDHLYKKRRYGSSNSRLNNELVLNSVQRLSVNPTERMLDTLISQGRKQLLPIEELEGSYRNRKQMDLRDRLGKKRRVVDGSPITCTSRRLKSSLLFGQRLQWPRRHRTVLDAGKSYSKSCDASGAFSNGSKRRRLRSDRSEQFFRLVAEFGNKSSVSTTFEGPKSLAQIREEKNKACECLRNTGHSAEFRGPRPLSEILEDKRNLIAAIDGNCSGN